jgi:hypothetical protein
MAARVALRPSRRVVTTIAIVAGAASVVAGVLPIAGVALVVTGIAMMVASRFERRQPAPAA